MNKEIKRNNLIKNSEKLEKIKEEAVEFKKEDKKIPDSKKQKLFQEQYDLFRQRSQITEELNRLEKRLIQNPNDEILKRKKGLLEEKLTLLSERMAELEKKEDFVSGVEKGPSEESWKAIKRTLDFAESPSPKERRAREKYKRFFRLAPKSPESENFCREKLEEFISLFGTEQDEYKKLRDTLKQNKLPVTREGFSIEPTEDFLVDHYLEVFRKGKYEPALKPLLEFSSYIYAISPYVQGRPFFDERISRALNEINGSKAIEILGEVLKEKKRIEEIEALIDILGCKNGWDKKFWNKINSKLLDFFDYLNSIKENKDLLKEIFYKGTAFHLPGSIYKLQHRIITKLMNFEQSEDSLERLVDLVKTKGIRARVVERLLALICNNLGFEETKIRFFKELKATKERGRKRKIREALKFLGYKNPRETMQEIVDLYKELDLENYWFTEKFTGQEFALLTGATENRNIADGETNIFKISKESIYQKPGVIVRVYTKEFTSGQSFIIKTHEIDYQIDYKNGTIEFKTPPPKDAIIQTLYWTEKDYKNKKGIFPLKDFEDKEIVELACGQGRLLKLFHRFGYRVSGLDIMENYLEDIKKDPEGANIKLDRGDFTRQPFKNESVRGLYCMMHSIMHLVFPHDQQNFFHESNRVMLAGDKLVFDTVDRSRGPYKILMEKYIDNLDKKAVWNFREGTIYDTPDGFSYCTRYIPSEADIKAWADSNGFEIVKKIKRPVEVPKGYIAAWARENQIAAKLEGKQIVRELERFRKSKLSAEDYFRKNKNTLLSLGSLKDFERAKLGAQEWLKKNYYLISNGRMKKLKEQAPSEKYTNIYWVLKKKKRRGQK